MKTFKESDLSSTLYVGIQVKERIIQEVSELMEKTSYDYR
jgi:hypothetical protein